MSSHSDQNTAFMPRHGELPHLGVLRVTGADAHAFLQGQLTADVRRLATDAPLLGAYCNPQGRVISLASWFTQGDAVLGLLPQELVAPTLERLRRFVLRAKVQLAAAGPDLAVYGFADERGARGAGLEPPTAPSRIAQAGAITLLRADAHSPRLIAVGERAQLAAVAGEAAAPDATAAWRAGWDLADVRAGWPRVHGETSELFVAQMLNLDLLDGISFAKGCYTGQEIVARTQHLGRIKRRTIRVELPTGEYRRGEPLRLPDGRSGRLLTVAAAGGAIEALAVMTLASAGGAPADDPRADEDGLAQPAVDAHELPLPYPLDPERGAA